MEKVNEHELEYRGGDSGPKYLFRGPNIDWGVLRFLPGQELGYHIHERVEETFYFTRGAPKMIVNGEEYRVKAGDAFRCEPGDKHNIINDTDGPIDAVFIKHIYDPKDKKDVE
ncbi:MAG: cupin domain-containing protein [Planctomycetes bacterium]|nr:cupin domain-containing protein [Planctomycetota bacterium]